jgi:hypothetical protein
MKTKLGVIATLTALSLSLPALAREILFEKVYRDSSIEVKCSLMSSGFEQEKLVRLQDLIREAELLPLSSNGFSFMLGETFYRAYGGVDPAGITLELDGIRKLNRPGEATKTLVEEIDERCD